MRTFTVKMIWDEGCWHTSTEAPLCLTLNSDSYDTLVERVRIAAPEIIGMNCDYTGPIKLIFISEREEMILEAV